jgi:hypothetical protein
MNNLFTVRCETKNLFALFFVINIFHAVLPYHVRWYKNAPHPISTIVNDRNSYLIMPMRDRQSEAMKGKKMFIYIEAKSKYKSLSAFNDMCYVGVQIVTKQINN